MKKFRPLEALSSAIEDASDITRRQDAHTTQFFKQVQDGLTNLEDALIGFLDGKLSTAQFKKRIG